jgi:hypothetical protein
MDDGEHRSVDRLGITGALPGIAVDVDSAGDETVFGWKLFAGYPFNSYFALEGGYASLGEAKGDLRFNCSGARTRRYGAGSELRMHRSPP